MTSKIYDYRMYLCNDYKVWLLSSETIGIFKGHITGEQLRKTLLVKQIFWPGL